MPKQWEVERSDRYDRDAKWWEKKREREYQAVHDNLDTLLEVLNVGVPFARAKFGFLKSERRGVFRISEAGGGVSLMPTRLYICPIEVRATLVLLAMGDKTAQSEDIKACHKMAATL